MNHSRRVVVSYKPKYVHEVLVNCLHDKINGSPVSLTENSFFRKTDFLKKSQIFKNPLIVLPFFLLKAISCDNLAEVAEKNQYWYRKEAW